MEQRDRLLYQYKNSTKFKDFLNALFVIVDLCSPINLLNYLSIDDAEGDWLTQLCNTFNVPRYYTAVGSAFILDYSQLDGTDLLDGGGSAIGDVALRSLLIARVMGNNAEVKSVDYIYNVFNTAIIPEDIEIVEGIKSLTINLDFIYNSAPHRKYLAVTSIDNKWFGCPASTSVTYNVTLV